MAELRPRVLSWTALLGRWIEYAQSSVALPQDGEGMRWRESVVHIIHLQAVTFALAELQELPEEERALALDKAEILIRHACRELDSIWRAQAMPEAMLELMADARAALRTACTVGGIELCWPGPGRFVMPEVRVEMYPGSLAVMQPGTIVMPGEPVAWWIGGEGVVVDGCERHDMAGPRQVYRQVDEAGRVTQDLISPLETHLPPGMPLLVPLFDRGTRIGHFTVEARDWQKRQEAAMVSEMIPVVTLNSSE